MACRTVTILIALFYLQHLCELATVAAEKSLCPHRCTCKRSKTQQDEQNDLWLVQCGGHSANQLITIKEIEFGDIEPLIVQLDLSQNQISFVEFESFLNMSNLRRLDLSFNHISLVTETMLGEIKNLERLKLQNNSIAHIHQGSFDGLPLLKQLDVSSNPLVCDCDLLWLVPWAQNASVKLLQKPKCASPEVFRNELLTKLRIGSDFHCETPLQTLIELSPDTTQLIFEGDSLALRCRAPRVAVGDIKDSEDLHTSKMSQFYWGWSETIRSPDSLQHIVFSDPQVKFPSITIESKILSDNGLIDSILRIPYTIRNHSGTWDCRLKSDPTGLSRSVNVLVISDKTKYCTPHETKDNRGRYSWPKTIRGRIVTLPCQHDAPEAGSASYKCNEFGQWEDLNVTSCPYVRETTRLLETFSTFNMSDVPDSVVDSARKLRNYTLTNIVLGQLGDPMDLVFLARTINNYLDFVAKESELGELLLDIMAEVMRLPGHLMQRSQQIDSTGTKLVTATEIIALQSHTKAFNQYIASAKFATDTLNGITCTWLRSETHQREFNCFPPDEYYSLLPLNEKAIESSVQIPEKLKFAMPKTLLISVFKNSNLFPQNKTQSNFLVTSNVVGVKQKNTVGNLTEPIYVMLRAKPFHDPISAPKPVLWDQELAVWTNQGCQTSHMINGILVFSCNRLGYYGLMQSSQFLNDFDDERAGQRFRFSPPAFYVGGTILFVCLWINVTTYLVYGKSIQMSRRIKHSLINTWLSMSLLVFSFTVGIFQTENYHICQAFGISIHYLSLSVLLWICVSVSHMYKRVSKMERSPHFLQQPDDAPPREVRERKPILGLYFVGWGIALLVCGISGAVNMDEYASYYHCFMRVGPALSAIFVPAALIVFYLSILFLCIRFHLKSREMGGHLSEGTQITENVDLDMIEAPNMAAAAAAAAAGVVNQMNRSVSICTPTSGTNAAEDQEHSARTQMKAYVIVLFLYLITWLTAAMGISTPLTGGVLQYEEEIFSVIYAVCATILGLFVLFFYGISRSDVRTIWSTIRKVRNRGYSCRPANMINFKELTAAAADATAVVYQANVSRSNSQSSKHRPISNGFKMAASELNTLLRNESPGSGQKPPNLILLHRQQFVHNSMTLGSSVSAAEPNNADIFYNPNQSHVARRFFRKQKRLAKQNNIEIQRRPDDASSDISSIVGAGYPAKFREMFGSGSKVNNTNIHVEFFKTFENAYSKESRQQFAEGADVVVGGSGGGVGGGGPPDLFMDVCSDGLRLNTGKSPKNNPVEVANIYTNIPETSEPGHEVVTMRAEDKFKKTLVDIDEEEDIRASSESPQYVNTPIKQKRQQPLLEEPHYFEYEPAVDALAMNTVGLPLCKSTSGSLRSHDSNNTILKLGKDDQYISPALEITDKVYAKTEMLMVPDLNLSLLREKSKSLGDIATRSKYPETRTRSISCNDLTLFGQISPLKVSSVEMNTRRVEAESPILISPSMCDIGDFATSSNAFPVVTKSSEDAPNFVIFNAQLTAQRNLTSSPTTFSEFYPNSEISIQSQDLYGPQDNDLNIILAAKDHLNFQISDVEDENDIDEAYNCSRDYLLYPEKSGGEEAADALNESHSSIDDDRLDELYQQIKRNDNHVSGRLLLEDNDDYVNENGSQCSFVCQEDILNDN